MALEKVYIFQRVGVRIGRVFYKQAHSNDVYYSKFNIYCIYF